MLPPDDYAGTEDEWNRLSNRERRHIQNRILKEKGRISFERAKRMSKLSIEPESVPREVQPPPSEFEGTPDEWRNLSERERTQITIQKAVARGKQKAIARAEAEKRTRERASHVNAPIEAPPVVTAPATTEQHVDASYSKIYVVVLAVVIFACLFVHIVSRQTTKWSPETLTPKEKWIADKLERGGVSLPDDEARRRVADTVIKFSEAQERRRTGK